MLLFIRIIPYPLFLFDRQIKLGSAVNHIICKSYKLQSKNSDTILFRGSASGGRLDYLAALYVAQDEDSNSIKNL